MRCDAALAVWLAELHFPENRSLKEKRGPLTSLRDVLQRRFRASFAEVSHQDVWQRAGILVVLAASSVAQAEVRLSEVERYVYGRDDLEVTATLVRAVDRVGAVWDVLE